MKATNSAPLLSTSNAVFALLSTSVGGGMLVLPMATSYVGSLGALAILGLCAVITTISNEMLVDVASSVRDIEESARFATPFMPLLGGDEARTGNGGTRSAAASSRNDENVNLDDYLDDLENGDDDDTTNSTDSSSPLRGGIINNNNNNGGNNGEGNNRGNLLLQSANNSTITIVVEDEVAVEGYPRREPTSPFPPSPATITSSYTLLTAHILGSKGRAFSLMTLICVTYLASVSYLILAGKLLSELIDGVPPRENWNNYATLIVGASAFPLCMLRDISSLRYANILAVLSSAVLVGCVGKKAWEVHHDEERKRDLTTKAFPSSLDDVLYASPFFLLSFVAQFTVLPVYAELGGFSSSTTYHHHHHRQPINRAEIRAKMINVSRASVTCAFFLYASIALLGYHVAGDQTCDNVLSNFSRSPDASVARVALISTLLLSFPLLIVPCRRALFELLPFVSSSNTFNHLSMTLALVSSALALAVVAPTVSDVLSLVGSSFNLFLALLIPGLIHFARFRGYSSIVMITVSLVLIVAFTITFFRHVGVENANASEACKSRHNNKLITLSR